ncbi:MAG: flavodoxin family protein [Candidatus Eisenbacteria bacterium]|jgi:multimeric flavodoxin WrbA|nr:flavodoxin family protein [Candidatus Eisenbacteria bacterium]
MEPGNRPASVSAFVGSPRRGGNTEILVDEILQGASEEGANPTKHRLSELQIGPCRGCDACRELGECVQKDDMPALLRRMEESHIWVFGTPVYWWGPTAQFKLFMDRWYGAGAIVHPKGKLAILAVTLGDTQASTARHTVGMFEDALRYLDVELHATVIAAGVNARGEIRGFTDVLERARRTGRDAVAAFTDIGNRKGAT